MKKHYQFSAKRNVQVCSAEPARQIGGFYLMLSARQRRGVVAIAGFLLVVCSVLAALQYSGFCFSQFRFLTVTEKIERAVATLVSRDRNFIEVSRSQNYRDYEQNLKARVRQFMQEFPSCCRIGPEGGDGYPEPTFMRRLTGSIATIVVVEAPKPILQGSDVSGQNVKYQFAVSNCGSVW